MLDSFYHFFKEQNLQQSCQEVLNNPSCQYGLGLGTVSILSLLSYRWLSSKNQVIKDEDDGFEYIPTIDDLPVVRKLPIQSLLKAYFAKNEGPELHTALQIAIGKKARGREEPLTLPQVVDCVLANLGLPQDGSYPEELKDTDKNAEQIVDWCLARNRPAP